MKKIIFLLLCIPFIMFSSCNKPNEEKKDIATEEPPKKIEESYFSPYTGEKITKDIYDKIPFMVIIENSKDARPQSGLIQADIVYETMAEGGIPRFMALYHKNDSEKIGPVRSARPYFLDIAIENNLPFAHCGYSEEAEIRIKKEQLPSLNEFTYGKAYWRDKSRKYEHSLYTSSSKLRELIKQNKFSFSSKFHFKFNSDYWKNATLSDCSSTLLKLNKYYNTSYTYKDGLYYKYMSSNQCKNREDNAPIVVNNIIVQITDITLKKDALQHINIRLTGEGTCYIISNGKFIKGKWYKKDLNSNTVFLDDQNKEVPLSQGKTWWNIIDKQAEIKIK
ncbi:DUF3048 domain-containing protein [Clostridium lundense]|uniref:DUF3048 domain-containing protein n=1 Tax=Clostridium lundense TaxID=319475 RepID=UPI000483BBE2|nr:DUF3048 domain-containing protein [Clostridium lundense]